MELRAQVMTMVRVSGSLKTTTLRHSEEATKEKDMGRLEKEARATERVEKEERKARRAPRKERAKEKDTVVALEIPRMEELATVLRLSW